MDDFKIMRAIMEDDNPKAKVRKGNLAGIPRTVLALGLVSMFMDISSEMIHSLLPVFLVSVLQASPLTVGFIEGLAEAAALITKIFSGALSDWCQKRKFLAVAGYGLGALTKPLFALAPNAAVVFSARFVDRVGKGIRGAPRDALVADVTPIPIRGAAYGLRQSLDTIGAFLGPLLAVMLMFLSSGNFRFVFWVAVIPGLLSVAILLVGVKEPKHLSKELVKPSQYFKGIKELSNAYWFVVCLGVVFTLARFSEAFLLLRAQSAGMQAVMIPLMMALMNMVYSLTAYPAGYLSDRAGRHGLIVMGLAVLIVSDIILALGNGLIMIAAGIALWGFHMGLTQGLLSAMIADTAEDHLRGTAFGIFSLASGMAILMASVIAGWLWDSFGASATFFAGACFASIALIGFVLMKKMEVYSKSRIRFDGKAQDDEKTQHSY
ncbi:MAG: MFS transporter [Desulfobacterales bacterium]|jgi:MFS family permease|nr:MFS transporter [Desulfobacterales bacterium]